MSNVLKIDKWIKLEKDAVYIVKFNFEPNIETIRALQDQFQKINKTTGCSFIVFGREMDILSPSSLFDSAPLRKAISDLVLEELKKHEIRSSFSVQS